MTVFISHFENAWMWGLKINAKGFFRPSKAAKPIGMADADVLDSSCKVWFSHWVFDNIIP